MNQRTISNIAYVFDGFAPEGTTDYTSNGLNQYTETEAAPLLANGQPDPNPAPETVTATSYQYDANGNLTDTGRWTYTYDAENRLMSAHDTVTSKAVRFKYDGKGRRIAKLVDDHLGGIVAFAANKTYEYLYEGDEPIQDYLAVSGTFVITNRYVHGASVDERLVHWQYDQSTGAETKEQFYHRDHQGSIVAMSNGSGARADGELYTYDAFGNQVTGATTGQPFRYTGRRYDEETGLYYYRARYYSSDLGRFLQTDPIGYEDNMNMYAYVGNDPINNTDPTGKFLFQAIGAIAGGLASVAFEVATAVAAGQDLTVGGVAGAFAGGAAAGLVFASTGNLAAAGAAGGAVDSLVRQGIDNGIGNINVAEVGAEAAVGAVAGGVGGRAVSKLKIPSLTSGRGSIKHVAETQTTKALLSQTSRVSPTTAAKIGINAAVSGSAEGVASGTIGNVAAEAASEAAPDATLEQAAACTLGAQECNS